MESNKVRVTILGQTYNIKGDAAPEYIMQLADYVNEKVEEVGLNIGSANPLQIAILVSLNIADEFFQIKRISSGVEGSIEEKAREIMSLLDDGLIGDIFSGVGETAGRV